LFFFPLKLKTQCCEIAAHSHLFENKILQLQELLNYLYYHINENGFADTL